MPIQTLAGQLVDDAGNLTAATLAATGNVTALGLTATRGITAAYVAPVQAALTYAATISANPTVASSFTTTTVNATGNATINAANGGTAGQVVRFIITNDATSGKTITFGANFRPSATLVGTTSKTATVTFISDGTSLWEVSRATVL